MDTAVVNVKVNPLIKSEAQQVADNLGITLSGLINAFLRQLIRSGSVAFSLNEEPTKFLLKSLEESRNDIVKGRVSPKFKNADTAIKWLRNPDRRYAG